MMSVLFAWHIDVQVALTLFTVLNVFDIIQYTWQVSDMF